MSPKIALLIDAENISYQSLPHILKEVPLYGQLVLKAAYADWHNPTLQTWHEVALQNNFKIRHQANPARIKNASDMKLMMDAVEVLYGIRTRIDIFCLVTNDADFVPLCHRIHEAKRQVIGMGCKHAAEVFIRECDRFIFIPNGSSAPQISTPLASEISHDLPVKSPPAAPKPPVSVNTTSKALEPAPSNYPYELLSHLTKAFAAAPQDKDRWILLSNLGHALRQLQPGFKPKTYGSSTLSKLLQRIPDLVELKGSGGSTAARLKSSPVIKSSKPIEVPELISQAFSQIPWNIDGWVTLSALGAALRRVQSGFQPEGYGYQDLPQFLQAMPDCVELRTSEATLLARLKK